MILKQIFSFAGAAYLSLSTPLSITQAPVVSQPPLPAYMKPVALIKPISDPIPAEVAEVPLPTPPAPKPTYVAPAAPTGCSVWHSGDSTIDTLINRESGGRTCATNGGGCYGILQACPGYPLRAACGGDGACQLAWFTANKLGAYGSWGAALQHSYAYGWW